MVLSFSITIPPTTGYHSVRTFIPPQTIYTTTTLDKTTLFFIRSPVYDGGNGVMHGWDLDVKEKRELKIC